MRLPLLLALSTLTLAPVAQAQITIDTSTTTTLGGTCAGINFACTISDGTVSGTNVFHSFGDFSLPLAGDTVTFNNNLNAQNIFVRVTGGNPSNLNGTIQSGVLPNFNLFLLNANGIQFGPDITLNLGGSFIASTAQYINLADGTQIATNTPSAIPLTMSAPVGLQLGTNPAPIDVFGNLNIGAGQTLALIGGAINAQDSLLAASDGQVELGSVGANSFVGINPLATGFTFDYSNVSTFEDINLTQDTEVRGRTGTVRVRGRNINVSGGSRFTALPTFFEDGGLIDVFGSESVTFTGGFSGASAQNSGEIGNAGNVTVTTPQFVLQDGAWVNVNTQGIGSSGQIVVNANTVQISGSGVNPFNNQLIPTGLYAESTVAATGPGGSVTINANLLSVLQGGRITTSTASTQPGGGITINADTVNVSGIDNNSGFPSLISTEALASGQGGTLGITTRQLIVTDRGQLRVKTRSSGNAGNLNIIASELIYLDSNGTLLAETTGSGNAGQIAMQADRITIQNRGSATTRSTSTGNANTIDIIARSLWLNNGILSSSTQDTVGGSININARAEMNLDNNSIISAIATGTGTSGTINATTPNLNLRNNSQITVSNTGTGNSNNLNISASRISLDNNGKITSEAAAGTGGNITIRDWQTLSLNNSKISASTQDGQGGTLAVSGFGDLNLNNNSSIEAIATGTGTSGSATFSTTGAINLNNAKLSVSNTGTGNANNLTLWAPQIRLDNNAQITSEAAAGTGGNITIRDWQTLSLNNSKISASTQDGQGGTIAVSGFGDLNLNNNSSIEALATGSGTSGSTTFSTTGAINLNNSQLSVSNTGIGNSGNLEAQARDIFLSNQGRITASTAAGEGGNITLKVNRSIILRFNSEITATASGTGNGGNISLEAGRFILAIFSENSDVVANAFQGRGGNIYAKAIGIFGFRQFLGVRTPESDFVASSELGLDGSVTFDTQDNLSLDTLPDDFISTTLAQGCQLVNGNSPTKLSNSGSSGLPDNSGMIWDDIPTSTAQSDTSRTPNRIVEAQGVVVNEKGEVAFVASVPSSSATSCR